MVRLGADPGRITAVTGPRSAGGCYEVPAADARRGRRDRARGLGRAPVGAPRRVDVAAGVHAQLAALGVRDAASGPRSAPWSRPTTSPTAATGPPAGSPATYGWTAPRERRNRLPTDRATAADSPRISPGWRTASPPPAPPPGRTREEVTLDRGHQDLPGRRRDGSSRELGVRQVAENRDQDAAAKAAACADLPLAWHFVGQLQTNKVRSVVGYADCVHSSTGSELVTALSAAAATRRPGDRLPGPGRPRRARPGSRGSRGGVAPDGRRRAGRRAGRRRRGCGSTD